MFLRQIYDSSLAQYAYLIGCQRSGEALLIDPERDIDRYLDIAKANDLNITGVTETHIHADFVSGTKQFLETQSGVTAYLSDMGDDNWKYEWAKGHTDVQMLVDGTTFQVGKIQVTAIHTPGHTPEHLSFAIEDQGGGADEPVALITGDFVFVGDVGRPDLLESAAGHLGSQDPAARELFSSIQKLKRFPEYTQILPGHGAGSACGKALGAVPSSTVGYELRFNSPVITALNGSEQAFVDEILDAQPEPPIYFSRMKQVNKSGPDILPELPQPGQLTASEIEKHAGESTSVILDTRADRGEFMAGHLPGSLYAPLGSNFTAVAGSYVTPGEHIYLLLTDENDLQETVRQLVRIGLDHIMGWSLVSGLTDGEVDLVETKRDHITNIVSLRDSLPDALILDVRRAAEHNAGHIPGAKNIAHTRLAANLKEISNDTELLVHCASGGRASYAAAYLERKGFQVTYCDGFFSDWSDQNSEES